MSRSFGQDSTTCCHNRRLTTRGVPLPSQHRTGQRLPAVDGPWEMLSGRFGTQKDGTIMEMHSRNIAYAYPVSTSPQVTAPESGCRPIRFLDIALCHPACHGPHSRAHCAKPGHLCEVIVSLAGMNGGYTRHGNHVLLDTQRAATHVGARTRHLWNPLKTWFVRFAHPHQSSHLRLAIEMVLVTSVCPT